MKASFALHDAGDRAVGPSPRESEQGLKEQGYSVSGDRQKLFDRVLAEHGGMLGRIVASYEADRAHQEDLLQEVALAIWQALAGFRGDASLKTYAARVAHNRCINHVTSAVRAPRTTEMPDEVACDRDTPEDAVDRAAKREQLLAAVRTLPVIQREVVTLALEGFGHQEVADILGISANNATVRFARAKTALKEAMARHSRDGGGQ